MNCLFCDIELKKKSGKFYCSYSCYRKHATKTRIEEDPNKCGIRSIRTYFKWFRKYECSICKIEKWNEKEITLELDHIDGNHLNNNLDNLRWICPNCHSQTDTYKTKNLGKGRKHRRKQTAD